MKNKKPETEEKIDIGTPESLASEMYRELKKANQFRISQKHIANLQYL